MEHCVKDILHGCGLLRPSSTPAAPDLFEIRKDAEKASPEDAKYFHTYVCKMLYLSKRVRPECLGAVSFLSTRVQDCDSDDLRKLERLLGYLVGTSERGIVRRGTDERQNLYRCRIQGAHSQWKIAQQVRDYAR